MLDHMVVAWIESRSLRILNVINVKFPKKSRTFFFSDFMKYSKAINRKSKPGVKRNILKFPKKEIKIKKQEIGSK